MRVRQYRVYNPFDKSWKTELRVGDFWDCYKKRLSIEHRLLEKRRFRQWLARTAYRAPFRWVLQIQDWLFPGSGIA